MWGATTQNSRSVQSQSISIHAPRVGRDNIAEHTRKINQRFQSTRPGWGETQAKYPQSQFYQISIHAPRVGRDVRRSRSNQRLTNFNPRAPCGARRHTLPCPPCGCYFNPRAPCGARRGHIALCEVFVDISIHAPRVGRDSKFDDFTPSNLHKRYKRVLARPKNTREKGKIKQKLAYIHAFSAFLGCEGSGTFCALVLRTQYR